MIEIHLFEEGWGHWNNLEFLADFLHLTRQHVVNERLVWHMPFGRKSLEPAEHLGVKTNGDQLSRLIAKWRPSNPTHGSQLLAGERRNV